MCKEWHKTAGDIHWDYFLLLEDDLLDIFTVVEPTLRNRTAFGPKMVKLLLATGSEIDVMFKDLPEEMGWDRAVHSIGGFKEFASSGLGTTLYETCVEFRHTEIMVEPWSQMADGSTPDWWKAYNKVKHHRTRSYDSANLDNVCSAMAALYSLCRMLTSAEEGNGRNVEPHRAKVTGLSMGPVGQAVVG